MRARRRWRGPRARRPARPPCPGRAPARSPPPAAARRAAWCAPGLQSRNHWLNAGSGLDDAAPDEVGAGVGEHRRDGERPAQRHGLLAENAPRHRVARRAEAADQLGRFGQRFHRGQLVLGELGQPVRQQVLLDPGERGDALRVAGQAAVARRHRLAGRPAARPAGSAHGRARRPCPPRRSPPGPPRPGRRPARCRRWPPPRSAPPRPRRTGRGARRARPRSRRWCTPPAGRAVLPGRRGC